MIYIQSNNERTLPYHFDSACALYGALDSALDYRLTTYEEVQSGKFDNLIKSNLFVGSVEFMREVFKRIGKTDVRLPLNSDRESQICTMQVVRERVSKGEELFIKPIEIKLFTGLVVNNSFVYAALKDLSDDLKVLVYKPFPSKILSEWRLYIHNHKIVDARNYSGDFKVRPDYATCEEKVKVNKVQSFMHTDKAFPCAYTMDIAILDTPSLTGVDNVVVEFNDMWAIGNYGIENSLYLRMLKDRYFEIVKNIN